MTLVSLVATPAPCRRMGGTMNTFRRAVSLTAVCGISVIAFGATAASAGEVKGNGGYIKPPGTPLNGSSICAYSGQNDAFHDASQAESPMDALTRVQSYGQIIRTGERVPAFLRPGSACNGHTGFLAGGGEEP